MTSHPLFPVLPQVAPSEPAIPLVELEASAVLDRVLSQAGGVPFLAGRLMVRGRGAVGKSSTIESMAGREFDSQHRSTVGTEVQDLQLSHQASL